MAKYHDHYERVTWANGVTALSAEHMNNIEDGIEDLIEYKVEKETGKGLYPDTDKTKLAGIAAGAEVNQNAFSNVKVGSATIAADSKTDTLELVAGSNVTLTPDATNDKVTIAAKDTTYSAATTSAAGLMSAADKTKLNGIETGATKNTVASLIDLIYPVGSIYMSVSSTNPGTVFGRGTWAAWGSGKVPVGVNANDTSFNTVEKTGGSKNAVVGSHTHTATFAGTEVAAHTHTGPSHTHTGPSHSHNYSKSNGSTGSTTLTVDQIPSHTHDLPFEPVKTGGGDVGYAVNSGTTRLGTGSEVTKATGGGQGHSHTISLSSAATSNSGTGATGAAGTGNTSAAGKHTPAGTVTVASAGSSVTNANLQPYITCYMWKRTA